MNAYCSRCNARAVGDGTGGQVQIEHEESCPLRRKTEFIIAGALLILGLLIGAWVGHLLDSMRGWI